MGLYTHLYMVFVILVQNTFLLWQWRVKRVSGRTWCLSQAMSALPFLPWPLKNASFYWETFKGAASANGSWGRDLWMPASTPDLFVTVLREFFSGRPFSPDLTSTLDVMSIGPDWFQPVASLLASGPFALAFCLTLILFGFWRLRRQEDASNYAVLLFLSVLMPLLLMYLIGLRTRILATRYISFAFPSFFILLGLGVSLIRSRKVRLLLLAVLVATNGIGLANYYYNPDFQRDPWREVAQVLEARGQPGDIVFVSTDTIRVALDYYYRGSANRIGLTDPFRDKEAGAWTLMNNAMAGGTRAWLVAWMDAGLSAVYSDALRDHCRSLEHHQFRLIRVDLYASCVP
jgi:hypothetical protein